MADVEVLQQVRDTVAGAQVSGAGRERVRLAPALFSCRRILVARRRGPASPAASDAC